jgi:hypothetical protein
MQKIKSIVSGIKFALKYIAVIMAVVEILNFAVKTLENVKIEDEPQQNKK